MPTLKRMLKKPGKETETKKKDDVKVDGSGTERKLGEGGFGQVFKLKAGHIDIAKKVENNAMKISTLEREKSIMLSILKKTVHFEHKPVISVYSGDESNKEMYMKLVSEGTLIDYLRENALSDNDKLNLFKEIAVKLYQIHECGFIHCDIKPENILIHKSKTSEEVKVKIADLGVAIGMGETYLGQGTDGYRDIISYEKEARPRIDMYAFNYMFTWEKFKNNEGLVPEYLKLEDTSLSQELCNFFYTAMATNTQSEFCDCGKLIEALEEKIGINNNKTIDNIETTYDFIKLFKSANDENSKDKLYERLSSEDFQNKAILSWYSLKKLFAIEGIDLDRLNHCLFTNNNNELFSRIIDSGGELAKLYSIEGIDKGRLNDLLDGDFVKGHVHSVTDILKLYSVEGIDKGRLNDLLDGDFVKGHVHSVTDILKLYSAEGIAKEKLNGLLDGDFVKGIVHSVTDILELYRAEGIDKGKLNGLLDGDFVKGHVHSVTDILKLYRAEGIDKGKLNDLLADTKFVIDLCNGDSLKRHEDLATNFLKLYCAEGIAKEKLNHFVYLVNSLDDSKFEQVMLKSNMKYAQLYLIEGIDKRRLNKLLENQYYSLGLVGSAGGFAELYSIEGIDKGRLNKLLEDDFFVSHIVKSFSDFKVLDEITLKRGDCLMNLLVDKEFLPRFVKGYEEFSECCRMLQNDSFLIKEFLDDKNLMRQININEEQIIELSIKHGIMPPKRVVKCGSKLNPLIIQSPSSPCQSVTNEEFDKISHGCSNEKSRRNPQPVRNI